MAVIPRENKTKSAPSISHPICRYLIYSPRARRGYKSERWMICKVTRDRTAIITAIWKHIALIAPDATRRRRCIWSLPVESLNCVSDGYRVLGNIAGIKREMPLGKITSRAQSVGKWKRLVCCAVVCQYLGGLTHSVFAEIIADRVYTWLIG